jgi:SH3-like domain-containing protein
MRFPNRHLVLLTSLLIALISACSYDCNSSAAPGTPQRSRTVASAQEPTAVVVVKSPKANIREAPSRSGRVVTEVQKDQHLTVTRAAPAGPWYRVREEQTGAEGWIHGSTIAFESAPVATAAATPKRSESAQPRGVTPPPSGRSYVNVDGVRVPSPTFSETRPAGATARCRDGSYSFSQHRRGTCSWHGGVAAWY